MRDSQVLARGSKTATVVVLIVFFQLLVIAVLGLGAITRDRREGMRNALARADRDAIGTADDMVRWVRTSFEQAAARAVEIDKAEEFLYAQKSDEGKLWDVIYQVDAEGVVYWFTGSDRLWIPPLLVEVEVERSVQDEQKASEFETEFQRALAGGDYGTAKVNLWKLVQSHALWLDGKHEGYPKGVGWAIELLTAAAEDTTAPSPGPSFRQAFMKALETWAINLGRLSPEHKPMLKLLRDTVTKSFGCEVDAAELTVLADAFYAAREWFDALRPAVTEAVQRMRDLTAGAAGTTRILEVSGQTFAATLVRDTGRVVLARLDPDRARRFAASLVDAPRLERLSLRLEILPLRGPVPGEPEPLRVHDFAREGGGLELPFRAALYRDGAPELPEGGPTEAFYLGIISLAALGLVVGGVFLIRLWRREVHLARLKADFVSNLSHELKTPLTSISLFTEMLQEGKLESEEDKREGLAVLAQESQRLQRIVARMLDVARREVRGTPYDLVPGDLDAPVREAALRFRRIVTEPGLDLVVALSPEPLPVLMDPAAVDDAVTNLLSNAWKYKRGDRARIEVRTRRRGGKAEITVQDDGIGIPRNERKRVFQMFYRAENYLTRTVAGTGLGLALVRTIVRAHRGRIKLEPGHGGNGSLFRIRLPLARRRAATPAHAVPSAPPATLPTRVESPS